MSRAGFNWLFFFLLILSAWIGLAGYSVYESSNSVVPTGHLGALDPMFDVEFWRAVCLAAPQDQPFLFLVSMWGVMSIAMMAPTAFPMMLNFHWITQSKRQQAVNAAKGANVTPREAGLNGEIGISEYLPFPMLVLGYLSVWLGYSVIAAGSQYFLASQSLVTEHGLSVSEELTAALLMVAGAYQFSKFKEACLSKCRSPLAYFMGHWRGGSIGAYVMGLHHGMVCVGCCWALMLLGFVGGTMNLVWMGAAMLLMIVEKLSDIGRLVTKPLGVLLISASIYVFVRSLL
ncbi:MAG: DUF2182 domain-containing protein [Alphaproteobacteria bacterium]|nr:DUF2182 domain-containing protein [Alphaproteobacteria bacterium]